MSAENSQMFTCLTCRVGFYDADLQRQHYKTDWHRYNLKRKVANLPPVTSDEFDRRILLQREKDLEAKQVANVYCLHCRKNFNTLNAYENHLNSKKHRQNAIVNDNQSDSVLSHTSAHEATFTQHVKRDDDDATTTDDGMEIEEVDSDEWNECTENPIDNNDCLFCQHHSEDFVTNMAHMCTAHSFFVPDIEYCVDVKGLMSYLGAKITQGFMCIWCNERGKRFHSIESAQQHMIDKGHCRMLHEGETLAEYADFYDYSPSYPSVEGESDDASTDDVKDDDVDAQEIDGSGFQLVLPSGNVIGHRSLLRFYRQRYNPNRSIVANNKQKVNQIVSQYRLAGWHGTDRVAIAKKLRDIKYLQKMQNRVYLKMGVKANKFQKHFRQQVNF